MEIDIRYPSKVRTITTHEGIFLNLDDMQDLLLDDQVIAGSLAMLQVGAERGDCNVEVMRRALRSFIMGCAGWKPPKKKVDS